MAYNYPSNQQALMDIHWRQASPEGREYDGRYLLSELVFPNAWGDYFPLLTIINGIERRVAEQNAIATSLISALAAVNKGEAFDEAKLLAGVQAAAKSGVKDAIESISTTVTVK
jgi:hypothetical protein